MPYLAYGGVMVYIIPHYALDDEIRSYLVRNFQDLRVFMAPERRFKQCIVIGTRCRPTHATKAALQPLVDAQASEEGAPLMPDSWEQEPYVIPALQGIWSSTFMPCRSMKSSWSMNWPSSLTACCGRACRLTSLRRPAHAGRRFVT